MLACSGGVLWSMVCTFSQRVPRAVPRAPPGLPCRSTPPGAVALHRPSVGAVAPHRPSARAAARLRPPAGARGRLRAPRERALRRARPPVVRTHAHHGGHQGAPAGSPRSGARAHSKRGEWQLDVVTESTRDVSSICSRFLCREKVHRTHAEKLIAGQIFSCSYRRNQCC